MNLKKIKMLKVVLILGLTVTMIEARYHNVSSERSFNRILDNNELVVVMFYEGKEMRESVNDFKSAGRGEKYIAYVSVDVSKRDLTSLADTYSVKKKPMYLLIRNGAVYKNGRSSLVGEQRSSDIRNFVHDNFGDYLEDIKERKREEARESRPSVSFGVGYGYPYYGYYGYPYYGYYGYPYYYGRPGISFGIGF